MLHLELKENEVEIAHRAGKYRQEGMHKDLYGGGGGAGRGWGTSL